MYDLIIVGGGPAGSACGRKAGQLGLKTLLIEKEQFPRYKACGGALSEQAMSYLDFVLPDSIHEKQIYGARVHFRGQTIEEKQEYRIATLVTRSVLDDFLLKKAREVNIDIRTGEKVLECIEKVDAVEVTTSQNTFMTKYVVIAEGAQGTLKKIVRKQIGWDELGVCVVTEIEMDNEFIDRYIYRSIDIHFGIAGMGYGWVFPHDRYFSVGIGGFIESFPNLKSVMKQFLVHTGFTGMYNLKGHLIPAGGKQRKIYTSQTILCGDAAGFVDAFSGEGIAYAIRSGQIAAEVIFEAINTRKKSLANYGRRCTREFGDNLRYSLLMANIVHQSPGLFLTIMTRNADAIKKYLEVPARRLSYKEYMKWLFSRVPKHKLQNSQTDDSCNFQ